MGLRNSALPPREQLTRFVKLAKTFQEDDVKPGFYTDRGDWVPLDEKHIKEEEQEQ